MSKLAYLSDSVQLSLVSMKISFIYLSSPWVQGLRVLGYCLSPYITFCVLHVTIAFHELAKQIIIFTSTTNQQMHLYNFRFKHLKPLRYISIFVVPC